MLPHLARPTPARLRAVLLAVPLVVPRATPAQPDPDSARTRVAESPGMACVRALPPSALTRVPVFVYAEVADSSDRLARPAIDLVADAVGRRMRAAFAGSDTLVPADSGVRQTGLDGYLRVVARRGGGVAWRPVLPPSGDSTGVRLLARALGAAADSGDYFIADDALRGDSLVFRLDYTHPVPVAPGGPALPVRRRNPAPVFTLLVATEKQAGAARGLSIRYPASLQQGGFEGFVELEFVVDTAGRAEPRTLVDANPGTERALAGNLRVAYRDFLGAAHDAVLRTTFTPAEIGGCRVRQLVRLPVTFRLAR